MLSNIFIISGPSGSGQDSVIEGLAKRFPLERVKTTTTRPMRPGESEGDPYYFVSKDEFLVRKEAGEFVEYAQQYNGEWYGVTFEELERVSKSGKIGTWKIEYQGVRTAKQLFPEITAILIYASPEELERRIRARDTHASEEYVRQRMEYTREWLRHTDIYDHQIENSAGRLEETVAQVAEIIAHVQAKTA